MADYRIPGFDELFDSYSQEVRERREQNANDLDTTSTTSDEWLLNFATETPPPVPLEMVRSNTDPTGEPDTTS